jgi:molecular chaperone GrpE
LAKEKKKKLNDTENEKTPEKKAKPAKVKTESAKKEKPKKEGPKELKAQVAAEKDRVLRLSAEFENFKKRKQRELDDFKKFANETIFRQILSVVDNLERAISAAKDSADETALLDGVKLTYKDIVKLFETFNVKMVDAQDQVFDPNFHQAVNQEETDEVPENTVLTVLQKGYLLHDRLLRPAMVIVSKKTEKKTETIEEN